MISTLALASLVATSSATVYFKETFDSDWESRWVTGSGSGKVAVTAGKWYGDEELDAGLTTTQDAKFYHTSANFPEFSNKDKDLVLQFQVKHAQDIDCGGGYLKFMPAGLNNEEFNGDSEYNIMFGPDICGSTKKVHVIFNYKGENHLIKSTITPPQDELTHLYTLIVKSDQTFEVLIDGESKKTGSLTDEWDFLPPKMIKDPELSKPDDWVDESRIEDPDAVKPEGYDDIPASIVDPEAEMPEDWDEEDDGEWEAPMIPNSEYEGPWSAPMIENPAYEGPWVHPEIENPEYFTDDEIYAYDTFASVGLDVWQVKSGSIFDNIIITDSIEEANEFADETYKVMKDAEKKMYDDIKDAEREAEMAAMEDEEVEEDDWEEEEPAHDEL